MVEFDILTAVGIFVLLLLVILGGTVTSPMASSTKAMVSGGLVVFGVVTFWIGMKHGEYRAGR